MYVYRYIYEVICVLFIHRVSCLCSYCYHMSIQMLCSSISTTVCFIYEYDFR